MVGVGGPDPAAADLSPVDPYTVVWEQVAARLAASADAEADWSAAVAEVLVRGDDRLAVDVGCGGAGMTVALARALTAGQVVAVDADREVLAAARERVGAVGLAGPVAVGFVQADLAGDLGPVRAAFDGTGADVVWAAAAVHHAGDQQRAVDALAGLLAPGGRLVLAEGGLPPRCLPWDVGVGEPGLELRLDAAQDRWFARMRQRLPGSVPMPYGWTEALRRAGLSAVRTRSWLLEAAPPLSGADRDWVVADLGHRVERLRQTDLLAADDLASWDRLLDESDPAWLGNRGDLYRIRVRSLHIGVRPAGGPEGPAGAGSG